MFNNSYLKNFFDIVHVYLSAHNERNHCAESEYTFPLCPVYPPAL
jgi:hypothetical protein